MAKNPLIRSYPRRVSKPLSNKSAGILDDFSVRRNVATNTGTIEKTPVNDSDIANKKYVDDNAVSDHSALTNLDWFSAGHIMNADLVFENAATRSVKIDDARSGGNADDLNILAGNTVFHASAALDGGDVIIDGGVAQGAGATGDVKIANTRGKVILADGSTMVTSAAPNADAEIANKKYVDDNITPHTPEGTAVLSTGEGGGTKFLREDGDGTSSWQTPAAGGAPGGSDTQVQFNDAGAFGGSAKLKFDGNDLIFGTTDGDQILLNNGTNLAPSLSFQGETTTGIRGFGGGVAFVVQSGLRGYFDNGNRLRLTGRGGDGLTIVKDTDSDTGIGWPGLRDILHFEAGGVEFIRLIEHAQDILVFNEDGLDVDFRVETDTEPNFFFIDGADNTLRIGDMDTNYMQVDVAGKILFTGASGLAYGEIYVNDNTTVTSVSSAGFTQFLHFAVNGHNQNTSPDHTNDHITITKAGVYMVDCCVNIKNDSGAAHDIEVVISKNNNDAIFPNLRRHRTLGTGTDIGAIPLCGHISLAVNDTLEVWITSDSASARDVIAEDVTLMVTQVGGN